MTLDLALAAFHSLLNAALNRGLKLDNDVMHLELNPDDYEEMLDTMPEGLKKMQGPGRQIMQFGGMDVLRSPLVPLGTVRFITGALDVVVPRPTDGFTDEKGRKA